MDDGDADRLMKWCSRCKRHLMLDAFVPSERRGWRGWCRGCKAAYRRDWMAAHPGRRRGYYERERKPKPVRYCRICGERVPEHLRADAQFCGSVECTRARGRMRERRWRERRRKETGGDG
jgi:hypothetical protein